MEEVDFGFRSETESKCLYYITHHENKIYLENNLSRISRQYQTQRS